MARRKKEHHEEHADERWLITYADVLTLMFVLFMVLFSISVVNTSKFEELKQTLKEAFSGGVTDGGESVLNEMAKTAGLDMPAGATIAPIMPSQTGGDAAAQTAQALENRQLEAAQRAIDASVDRAGLEKSVTTRIDSADCGCASPPTRAVRLRDRRPAPRRRPPARPHRRRASPSCPTRSG